MFCKRVLRCSESCRSVFVADYHCIGVDADVTKGVVSKLSHVKLRLARRVTLSCSY
jgi:hypothetical protein